MPSPIAEATAYLEKLEADRRAAIAVSEQKSEEAKLIAARLEGFRAAMDILAGVIPEYDCALEARKPNSRRPRRDISQLILRELSFSGEAMTTGQIAKAIDYIPERTEAALERLEMSGELMRNEDGRWVTDVRQAAGANDHPSGGARAASA